MSRDSAGKLSRVCTLLTTLADPRACSNRLMCRHNTGGKRRTLICFTARCRRLQWLHTQAALVCSASWRENARRQSVKLMGASPARAACPAPSPPLLLPEAPPAATAVLPVAAAAAAAAAPSLPCLSVDGCKPQLCRGCGPPADASCRSKRKTSHNHHPQP